VALFNAITALNIKDIDFFDDAVDGKNCFADLLSGDRHGGDEGKIALNGGKPRKSLKAVGPFF
jgi:hypothetical protein